jgi:shikimate kinase
MILVLIGYRGTGKSIVGRLLAQRLKMTSLAMDAEIEKHAGMPIPEIVDRYGWQKFRDLETEVAMELSTRDNIIIDTGGGVIERPENMEALGKNACVVWLKASVENIVPRICGGTDRPALTAGKSFTEEVAEVLERRIPLYQAAADFEIDTDLLTPAQVADKIVEFWEQHKAS